MRDRIAIVLLVLVALALAAPLWGPGIVNTRGGGDSPFLLQRLHQMVVNLRAGVFPVRWMPDAAYGLGYPFFNYYSALPYYLGGALALVGFDLLTALKLVQTVGFVASALAMYGWMRCLVQARWSAWLAAVGYAAAPFHMVNVYVRGDSLSEFYAFVFYPLILWGLELAAEEAAHGQVRILAGLGVRWLLPAAAYAGLVCSHNISAFIFSPFALLYPLTWVVWNRDVHFAKSVRWRVLCACYVALGFGLLLSAWVWLPALTEIRYVQTTALTSDYFHYSHHFRGSDLVQRSVLFSYDTVPGRDSPFAMGLVQAAGTLLGLLVLVVRRVRVNREVGLPRQAGFLVFGLVLSTLMITPASRPLWDRLPLLPMVQFPWRFLSVQALFAAAMMSFLVPFRRWKRSVSLLVGAGLVLAVLLSLRPDRLMVSPADVTPERLHLYELFTQNIGTTIRSEWLPRAAVPRPFTSDALIEPNLPLSPIPFEGAHMQASIVRRLPVCQEWQISGLGGRLAFPVLFWPGWRAYVDGIPVEITPVEGSGYLSVVVPPGEHIVLLRLQRTPARIIAEVVSLCAILAAIVWSWLARFRVRWLSTLGAVALAVFPAFVFLVVPHRFSFVSSVLTMDFEQMPYLHAAENPTKGVEGLSFEGGVRLRRYALSKQELKPGDELTITLDWLGVNDVYTATALLVSPAALRYEIEPLAQAAVWVAGSTTTLTLDLPMDIPRGIYLLQLRLFGSQGELRALTSTGQRRGPLYLQPVRVPRGTALPADMPVLARFGRSIRLHTATLDQPSPDRLRVHLGWSVTKRLGTNYGISLRILDAQDRVVAMFDTQPGYGYLPTSMWRPNELVMDRYMLLLPSGLQSEAHYALQVILYQVRTGEAIGQARIGEFVLPLQEPFEARPSPKNFVLPRFSNGEGGYPREIGVEFGGQIRLAGYELIRTSNELRVTLWWQALATPVDDYIVFVHLFDPADETIVAQSDAMPRQGTYPTSGWSSGEVVSETIHFTLDQVPTGSYRLGIGLYDRNLIRLAAIDAAQQLIPDNRLVLPERVDIVTP